MTFSYAEEKTFYHIEQGWLSEWMTECSEIEFYKEETSLFFIPKYYEKNNSYEVNYDLNGV